MRKAALSILVFVEVLALVFGTSVLFPSEDAFERSAQVLISSFSLGMGVLGLTLTLAGLRRKHLWAWAALWVYPAFFVLHVIGLGTIFPDLVFAVLFAGALLILHPPSRTADALSEHMV